MPLQLDLTPEQAMFQDVLGRFIAERGGFEARAQRLKARPPQRMALWPEFAALGALAILIPEEAGGLGGAPTDVAVVQDCLAAGLLLEPVLIGGLVCGRVLRAAGQSLETLISGDVVYALAHAEGFDAFARPRVIAEARGNGLVLSGMKPAVRHADVADQFIVSAATPDGGMGLFLVAADAHGLGLALSRTIDGAGAGDLRLDSVAGEALVFAGDARSVIEDALLWGLAALCVETAALCRAANLATFDYMGLREQFGSRLAQFQALQHKAADMVIAAEEAAAMARQAVDALSLPSSRDRSRAILQSSLACDSAGRLIGHTAVQMFGGMGVSDELAISHYARRMTSVRAQFGTMDARAARLCGLEGHG